MKAAKAVGAGGRGCGDDRVEAELEVVAAAAAAMAVEKRRRKQAVGVEEMVTSGAIWLEPSDRLISWMQLAFVIPAVRLWQR